MKQVKLPEKYVNKMKDILGNEFEAYDNSLSLPMYSSIRINTLKISVKDFKSIYSN